MAGSDSIPEYQRRAVMEYVDGLRGKIEWYKDQIRKMEDEIRRHEEFLSGDKR